MRERVRRTLTRLHPSVRRFRNPHRYPAGLTEELHALRMNLIAKNRAASGAGQ